MRRSRDDWEKMKNRRSLGYTCVFSSYVWDVQLCMTIGRERARNEEEEEVKKKRNFQ